jgi:uncharacterized protein YlxP (DUF503 family)
MAPIGVITLELKLEHSRSLKDKRQVVKSLKDKLRRRHNVSVAEIDYQDLWQRALIAAVTVSGSRMVAEQTLRTVEDDAASIAGPYLVDATVEWLE